MDHAYELLRVLAAVASDLLRRTGHIYFSTQDLTELHMLFTCQHISKEHIYLPRLLQTCHGQFGLPCFYQDGIAC